MTGSELWNSGIGSNRSTSWATTTAQLCLVLCNALNLLWKKLIDLNANKEKTKLMIIQKKKLQLQIHFSSSFRFNAFKVNYSSFITVAFSLFSIPRYTSLKLPRSIDLKHWRCDAPASCSTSYLRPMLSSNYD